MYMKWKIILPLVAVVVIVGGLVMAHAQSANRNGGVFGRGSVLTKVANQLQLTDDQRTQIKGILVAEKDPLVSLLTRLHQAHIQLSQAIGADNATEESVRTAAAGVATVDADLAVERYKLHTKIYPLLTAAQQKKAAELETKVDLFVDGIIARIGAGLRQ
jgi:Spy/CpxP family protein refolding chaperone